MYYISLDLEWNQAYYEQSQAVQKRLKSRLLGEVIQIGAVKLDDSMRVCGSFSVIIKPRFFRRIQRHVMQLTGITQDNIDRGMPLQQASEQFRQWCGTDCVFITWGPDDVPMFTDNLRANGLDTAWIPPLYDLQVIYNMQTDNSSKQRSLEYAMEQLGLIQNLPAHDALNDALFTAMVAQKLDLAKGIKAYENRRGQYLFMNIIGNSDVGETGFESQDALLKVPEIDRPVCPVCAKPLSKCGRMLHAKGQRYSMLTECAEHGKMMLQVKVTRNLNETLRAKVTLSEANEETVSAYEAKLRAAAASNAAHRSRRRRSRRKTVAEGSVPAAK